MEHLSGQQLTEKVSKLILENNLDEAVKVFNILVEKLPDAHLPLLSRCTCLIQLERYEEAKIDAEKILTLPNIPISDDIAPGNTTLHSVGYARLAKCYKELGQIKEAEKLLKKRQELEKKVLSRKDIENMNSNSSDDSDNDNIISENSSKNAEKFRLQGNELYKKQKYNESLEKYMKAFELNQNDLLVNSNCAQVYLKLGKLDEALIHAETCIRLDSKWAKGYYRKGCILLEKKKFLDSISAFQLAKRYGANESDLEKKIEFVNKQIKQQSKIVSNNTFRDSLSRFKLSSFTIAALVVVLISIFVWFFVDISTLSSIKKFFSRLLYSYFGDLW
ncbi:RNA polymerase II-associated protein 3 [Gigaspora margarita]|uniref:RNA polymerase II-associated protein 3 n=1 Tax=Gigaspora margarita TaxID=4874 RepID=A0A8H4B5B6_GIGMA|nr:RNA polymerase II-associated protein 3 [Gigaspora margarita]